MKKTLLLFFMLTTYVLFSQWSNDPALNTQISDLNGDQTIPKTAQYSDGSCYFGWWDNSSGNYNMRLQRLNIDGNEVWEENGILVSGNPQMSWLMDWDMTVDLEGNAIMAFYDIREGESQLEIFAYKISPEGAFIWGENGINLSNGGSNSAPKVTVTENNNCIYAWTDDSVIKIMSVSPAGELLWNNPVIISEQDRCTWPQLLPATGDDSTGNFLIKYYVDTGATWAPDRSVFLQKFDENGDPVWQQPAVISDALGITAWTQVISFVPDSSGGAVLAWHDDRNSENTTRAYAQHITSNGTSLFDDGILVADHAPNQMYYPSAVYQPESEMIFVFWRETDAGQNNAGIFGQKINSTGELLFQNSGLLISPVQGNGGTIVGTGPFGEDLMVVYTLYPWGNYVDEQILAEKIDQEGELLWNETLIISDMQLEKLHTDLADFRWTENGFSPDDAFILSWGSGSNGIFAQRFNDNGTIGGPPFELAAPINLTADVFGFTVDLLWQMPDDRALTGFCVYRDDELIYNITDPDIREYEDYVTEYITYEYYLTAVYEEGISEPSDTVTVTPVEVHWPPFNLTVNSATGFLEWEEPIIPPRELSGYNVYLNDDLQGYTTETCYQLADLEAEVSYCAGVSAVYNDSESEIVELEFVFSPVSDDENDIPKYTSLSGNYPNPFNPNTTIEFQLASSDRVKICIYNFRGQLVEILYKGYLKAGKYHLNWNADEYPSGVYYGILSGDGFCHNCKMMLLK